MSTKKGQLDESHGHQKNQDVDDDGPWNHGILLLLPGKKPKSQDLRRFSKGFPGPRSPRCSGSHQNFPCPSTQQDLGPRDTRAARFGTRHVEPRHTGGRCPRGIRKYHAPGTGSMALLKIPDLTIKQFHCEAWTCCCKNGTEMVFVCMLKELRSSPTSILSARHPSCQR